MAAKQNSVELLIRARDETQRAIKSASTGLERFAAAQAKTAARRDQFAGIQKSARDLATEYDRVAARAAELGTKLGRAKRPSEALKQEFASARAEARRLKDEYLGLAVAAGRMNGKVGRTGSFAAFEQKITAREDFERAAAGAARAKIATDRFADALGRVAAYQQRKDRFAAFDAVAMGAKRAEVAVEAETAALNANTAALGRNASATRRRGDVADRITAKSAARDGKPFRLGADELRPYQVQNLGYQVNDVFTQLASGTPVAQVFAQQIGQIAQLLPKTVASFVRLAPVIGVVTVAMAPFITAMNRANGEAEALKDFNLLLARSGEAASYTAPKLLEVAQNLDSYAGSLKDARASLNEFVGDSVAPEYLEAFGRTALDFAKVMKVDVTDAAKKVSDAFTGNADAVLALDDELNFLTDSERDHVKLLREQKRDAEARTYAFDIFSRKYGETAAQMRGPWSQILRDFGAAWGRFVDIVNFIDFRRARARISQLMSDIQRLTGMLPGANKSGITNLNATLRRNAAEIEQIADAQEAARQAGTLGQGGDRAAVAAQTRRLALLRRENREILDQINETNAAERERQGILAADTTLDPPANANSGAGRDRVTDAERLAKLQAEFNEDLEAQNRARSTDLANLRETQRELTIIAAIESARARAADQHIVFTEGQAASIRDSVGALYDAQKIAAALMDTDRARLELAEARNEVESRSVSIARQLKEAGYDPGTIRDLTDVLQPGNIDLANRPIAVNEDGSISTVRSISIEVDGQVALIPTVGPNGSVLSDEDAIKLFEDTGDHLGIFATLEAAEKYARDLHSAQEIYYSEEVQNLKTILGLTWDINDATRQQEAAQKKVNDLVSLRSTLQSRVEFLDDAGQAVAADLLREQIVALDTEIVQAANDAIALMQALGGPDSAQAIATLQTIRDTAAGVGQNAIFSGRQLNELLANGATNAFEQFAQALGEGDNAIRALGDAFRQFAADFLREIARMILQQIILNALQQAGGGGGGQGGGIGSTIASSLNSVFGGKTPIGKHTGGVIGSSGKRSAPIHAFNQALRYHTGGVLGLKPNEVPIVGLRGEEMLTEDDPRHRNNGGLARKGGSVKVVNVFDPVEFLDKALAGDDGGRVLLNYVRANSSAFKAAIG